MEEWFRVPPKRVTGCTLPHHLSPERAALLEDRGPLAIVDIGCGRNLLAPYFRSRGHRFVGVDVCHPCADLQCAIEDLPFRDGSFDAVLTGATLQFVIDLRRAFKEMYRVLVAGGTVTGTVAFLEPWVWDSLVHLTPGGAVRLLEDAGFRTEYLWPSWGVDEALAETLPLVNPAAPLFPLAIGPILHSTLDRLRFAASFSFHAVRPP